MINGSAAFTVQQLKENTHFLFSHRFLFVVYLFFCCQSVRLLLHCDDDDDQTKPVATSDNIRTRERDTWNTRLSRRLNNNSLGVLFRRMATATRSAGNKCLATMLLAKYCYRTLAPTLSGAATTIAMHFTTRMLSNMLLHFAHVLRQFCYCLFLSHDGECSPIGL